MNNITKINEEIKNLINPNNQQTIQKYKKELLHLESELKKQTNYKQIKKLQSETEDLKDKIENLENGSYFVEYVAFADQILNEYLSLNKKKTSISPTLQILNGIHVAHKLSPELMVKEYDSFSQILKSPIVNDKQQKNTLYISKLLSVARKYINIEPIEKKYIVVEDKKTISDKNNKYEICKNCNNQEGLMDSYKGFIICKKCGFQFVNAFCVDKQNMEFNSSERINTKQRYKYERLNHFENVIDEFQGSCKKNIPKSLFIELEKNLDSYKLLNNDSINKKLKYSEVTKSHIRRFLKNSKNSKYYKDINYIYHRLTNKKIPDISEYVDILKDDFKKLLDAHTSLKFTDRTNFLNGQYILFQLLRKNGYNCIENDFIMLKAIDKRKEHDRIYEKCCDVLNWHFIPINILK